jgi:hypothetical protein
MPWRRHVQADPADRAQKLATMARVFRWRNLQTRGACQMESILGIAGLFGIFAVLGALYWRFVR